MTRWLKFSVVGLMGVGVQLAALNILVKLGIHYLLATALAVEIALLHNYAWHSRWTFVGAPGSESAASRENTTGRLLRFHIANGLISVLSNLAWMRVLTGWRGMPPVTANVIAIGATALLNFALADRWVFKAKTAVDGATIS